MLIYHITNEILYVTQVILSPTKTSVTTFEKKKSEVIDNHKDAVEMLDNDSNVFVTGDSSLAGLQGPYFAPRSKFKRYLDVTPYDCNKKEIKDEIN